VITAEKIADPMDYLEDESFSDLAALLKVTDSYSWMNESSKYYLFNLLLAWEIL